MTTLAVPITEAGDVIYPLSGIVTGVPFERISMLQFRVIARSNDFAVSLDQITAIPEPATAVCVAGGLGALVWRRRRRGAREAHRSSD